MLQNLVGDNPVSNSPNIFDSPGTSLDLGSPEPKNNVFGIFDEPKKEESEKKEIDTNTNAEIQFY